MEAKYKNIRFSSPSSSNECKKLLLKYINDSKERRKHKIPHIYQPPSHIQKISNRIENFVRNIHGSEDDRFLLYDVIYGGAFHTKLAEIDLLNFEDTKNIKIGEVKLTCNKSNAIHEGVKQLKMRNEILKYQFNTVKCDLIIIDILNFSTETITDNTIFGNTKSIQNEDGFEYNLIEISASQLFKYLSYKNLFFSDLDDLLTNVTNEAIENYEIRMQNKVDKISKKIELIILDKILNPILIN